MVNIPSHGWFMALFYPHYLKQATVALESSSIPGSYLVILLSSDLALVDMGGSINGGTPNSWMVFVMENPIKMDDDWGTLVLENLHIYIYIYVLQLLDFIGSFPHFCSSCFFSVGTLHPTCGRKVSRRRAKCCSRRICGWCTSPPCHPLWNPWGCHLVPRKVGDVPGLPEAVEPNVGRLRTGHSCSEGDGV